jgi:hypothetical protein
MARKRIPGSPEQKVLDYRHEDARRKNIAPGGLAAEGAPPTRLRFLPKAEGRAIK